MTGERWRRYNKSSVIAAVENLGEVSFKNLLGYVWDYVASRRTELILASDDGKLDMTPDESNAFIRRCITEYIDERQPSVTGFVNENGQKELTRLIKNLDDIMTGYSVLTQAFLDPTLTEIQVNAYNSIWIERNGKFSRYYDEVTGKPVQFMDADELMNFINKFLINSPSLLDNSNAKAIGNAITPEGYRVAAIGPAAMAEDKGKEYGRQKSPACVIRKFSDKIISGQDLINWYTSSDDMDKFIGCLGNNKATVVFGGSTGSGKTVNLQRCIDGFDDDLRVISAEKDSELRLRRFAADGTLTNNVIQLEYLPENKSKTYTTFHNTMENEFNQMLRFTPTTIVFGELRSDDEINLIPRATSAGHNIMCTLHTDTPEQCIERITQAVMRSSPGASKIDVMQTICSAIDIVVIPSRMKDHTRKILFISEIVGCEVKDGVALPIVNHLWKFKQRGYVMNPETKKYMTYGEHVRLNPISEKLFEKWSRVGMEPEMEEFLTRPIYKEWIDPISHKTHTYEPCYYNGKRSPYAYPPSYKQRIVSEVR